MGKSRAFEILPESQTFTITHPLPLHPTTPDTATQPGLVILDVDQTMSELMIEALTQSWKMESKIKENEEEKKKDKKREEKLRFLALGT